MAGRIRSIKPELLEDEVAAALSDAAWRLFVSSWLLCDDHGRFRAGARYLAAQVWQDTTKTSLAATALAELAAAGRVRVYQIDGQAYAEIPTWAKHQRIDNAGKPRVPPPALVSGRDSGHLASVPPRDSASLGEPPRVAAGAPAPAARPPTTIPTTIPTSDPEHVRADTHTREDVPDRTSSVPDLIHGYGPVDTAGITQPQTPSQAPSLPERVVELEPPAESQPKLAGVPEAEAAPLAELVRTLCDEGSPLGASVAARMAKGHRPTDGQLQTLRKIRDERAAAPARASPRGGGRMLALQQPAGPGERTWPMPEEKVL